MSIEKFEELIALLRLKPGAQVLEIAMGGGEFIIRLAERYKIGGIGIESSRRTVFRMPRESMKNVFQMLS